MEVDEDAAKHEEGQQHADEGGESNAPLGEAQALFEPGIVFGSKHTDISCLGVCRPPTYQVGDPRLIGDDGFWNRIDRLLASLFTESGR